MKYILNLDLSTFEYFPRVENKWIENYLISKYGNVFQYKVNILRIYHFEDKLKRKLKWIIEIEYSLMSWNYKFAKEFIKESEIGLKINIDLFLKYWKLYIL